MSRLAIATVAAFALGAAPALGITGSAFSAYLGGEGEADSPSVYCDHDPSRGVACMPMALGPVGACRVSGSATPGQRFREVRINRRGAPRVVRPCYVERDVGGVPTLTLGDRWTRGGVTCRIALSGRGIGATTYLTCRNTSRRGFRVTPPGRIGVRP